MAVRPLRPAYVGVAGAATGAANGRFHRCYAGDREGWRLDGPYGRPPVRVSGGPGSGACAATVVGPHLSGDPAEAA